MLRILFLATGLVMAWTATGLGQTVDTAESLQLAVRRMDAWLGAGPKAEGWRRALWIAALESQAAQGHAADPQMLRKILRQFDSGYPGLEHQRFQEVRQHLERHIGRLESAAGRDLNAMIAAARSTFQPVSAAQIDGLRREALAQLEQMQRMSGRSMPAEDREKLFYGLALSEIQEELRKLDPARLLPPARPAEETPQQLRMPSEDTGDSALAEEQKQKEEAEAARIEQEKKDREQTERERVAERTRLLRILVGAMRKFDAASLEQTDIWFLSAVTSLDRFTRTLAAATSNRTRQEYEEALELLEKNLPLLDDPANGQAAVIVGEQLGRIAHALQAPELVTAIRRRYSRPNAEVSISTSLLSRTINRTGGDTRPVDEVILGRQIYGVANTNNQVTLEFLDDPHQVTASIHLNGGIQSQTYTTQGPITAFASSSGAFEGRRNLYANIGGFYTTDPYVAARLESMFEGTSCRLRLVNRVANKQYWRDKYTSEGIAAARAERRILGEFGSQTETGLGVARRNLGEAIPTLFDVARWVPDLALSSHPGGVRAIATRWDPSRIAAGTPAITPRGASDLRIAIHQSAVGNYLDPILAGQKYSNEQLGELFRKLGGEVPEAFQAADESESWSITFPPTGAVTARFDDQKLNLQITGRRFSRDKTEIDALLHIRLEFQIVRRNGNLVLIQSSKPVVDYADPDQKDARVVGFKSFLEGKLEDSFDPEKGGVPLPANLFPLERIQRQQLRDVARDLELTELRLESGWLAAGWKRAAGGRLLAATDTPAIRPWTPAPVPPATPAADANKASGDAEQPAQPSEEGPELR